MKMKNIGSNQTELSLDNGVTVLFSYQTPVAIHIPGKGYYRAERMYSITTTRHVNKWAHNPVPLEQWAIEAYANGQDPCGWLGLLRKNS